MNKTLRLATVGTSWITEALIGSLKHAEGFELSAVYSRDLEKAKAFGAGFGCDRCFDDLQKLAEWDGIDAVYIASPNVLHVPQSRLFLKNGKHVLCEKPVADSAGEYKELSTLADAGGLVYMEVLMYMHHPEREKIKQAIARLGRIFTARLDFSQLSSKYQSLMQGKIPNIFNPKMAAGCLADMGCYCVYPALDWFGMPDSIDYSAGFVQTGADGYGNGILHYPDRQVNISLTKTGQGRIGSEILGDQGTMTIGFIVEMKDVFLISKDGQTEQIVRNYTREELMGAEARNFLNTVLHFGKFEKEYRQLQKETLDACRVLEAMRTKAGIRYQKP